MNSVIKFRLLFSLAGNLFLTVSLLRRDIITQILLRRTTGHQLCRKINSNVIIACRRLAAAVKNHSEWCELWSVELIRAPLLPNGLWRYNKKCELKWIPSLVSYKSNSGMKYSDSISTLGVYLVPAKRRLGINDPKLTPSWRVDKTKPDIS